MASGQSARAIFSLYAAYLRISRPQCLISNSRRGRSGHCSPFKRQRDIGLNGLAPLRDAVRPPHRPDPTRGRGRPRLDQADDPADSVAPPLPSAPLTPIDRRQFDYSDLVHWMAQMDQAIRHARRTLRALAPPTRTEAGLSNEPLDAGLPAPSLDTPADPDHQSEQPAPALE
jgi:hypothetical protein